jgi:hypothetical protein
MSLAIAMLTPAGAAMAQSSEPANQTQPVVPQLLTSPVLRVEIDGPEFVLVGTPATYRISCVGMDGKPMQVAEPVEWSIVYGSDARIDGSGILAVEKAHKATVSLRATVQIAGVEWTVTKDVRSIDKDQLRSIALQFDGHGSFVRIPQSPRLRPAEFTVSVWARLDGSQPQNARFVRELHGGGGGFVLGASQAGFPNVCFHPNGVWLRDPSPNSKYEGTWHHFAGVYCADRASLFVDGVEVATQRHTEGPMRWTPETDLVIGWEDFRGCIEDARFWKRPLTNAEVRATMYAPPAYADSGLVAAWRLNDGTGTAVQDYSANGLHGVLAAIGAGGAPPVWVISDAPSSAPRRPDSHSSDKQNARGARERSLQEEMTRVTERARKLVSAADALDPRHQAIPQRIQQGLGGDTQAAWRGCVEQAATAWMTSLAALSELQSLRNRAVQMGIGLDSSFDLPGETRRAQAMINWLKEHWNTPTY